MTASKFSVALVMAHDTENVVSLLAPCTDEVPDDSNPSDSTMSKKMRKRIAKREAKKQRKLQRITERQKAATCRTAEIEANDTVVSEVHESVTSHHLRWTTLSASTPQHFGLNGNRSARR